MQFLSFLFFQYVLVPFTESFCPVYDTDAMEYKTMYGFFVVDDGDFLHSFYLSGSSTSLLDKKSSENILMCSQTLASVEYKACFKKSHHYFVAPPEYRKKCQKAKKNKNPE